MVEMRFVSKSFTWKCLKEIYFFVKYLVDFLIHTIYIKYYQADLTGTISGLFTEQQVRIFKLNRTAPFHLTNNPSKHINGVYY